MPGQRDEDSYSRDVRWKEGRAKALRTSTGGHIRVKEGCTCLLPGPGHQHRPIAESEFAESERSVREGTSVGIWGPGSRPTDGRGNALARIAKKDGGGSPGPRHQHRPSRLPMPVGQRTGRSAKDCRPVPRGAYGQSG
jgi:hypothetical protein